MPGPAAVPVALSERHRGLMERLLRRQSSSQRLVRRIQVVLEAARGSTNEAIAKRWKVSTNAVRLWRARGSGLGTRLDEVEAALRLEDLSESRTEALLLRVLEEALADAPRPGAPATFAPEQMVAIVALALEDPADSGRPVSHWTPREIADEAMKRRIVPRISPRSVGRFLKGGRPPTPSQPVLASTGDRRSEGL